MLQRLCAANFGTLPSSFMTESITRYGFQSLPSHVQTQMMSASALTSTDPCYISWCYDMLTNLAASHMDTRVAMNRGG